MKASEAELRRELLEKAEILDRVADFLPPGLALTVRGDAMRARRVAGAPKCVCRPECEFPCWQRPGVTDDPCCAGCDPWEPTV